MDPLYFTGVVRVSNLPGIAAGNRTHIRTIFQQPTYEMAEAQIKRIVSERAKAEDLLEAASVDTLTHMHFPKGQRRRIRSTNPLDRLSREMGRRINVVGIFPNRKAAIRTLKEAEIAKAS